MYADTTRMKNPAEIEGGAQTQQGKTNSAKNADKNTNTNTNAINLNPAKIEDERGSSNTTRKNQLS